MNTERIAKGWALIAEGAMELSLAYESIDTSAARADAAAGEGAKAAQPSSPAAPVASVAAAPPPAAEVINITECPKHHVPFEAGQYGPYCKQATDDPAWGKVKGDRMWCRITPKNAPDYLRMQAA
jgi:hypothetical protein